MSHLYHSPLIGIVLCCTSYLGGVWLQKKTRSVFCNPVLIALITCIMTMQVMGITLEQFYNGASTIQLFLAPATCALALSIYRQRTILRHYFIPVICGCMVSSFVSIIGSFILGTLFQLDKVITMSTVPNSVTSAIAIDLAEQLGGIVSIAILCVIITGIAGAILSPYLIKIFHITDEVEMGVAIGASSHVIGTSKAVELGEIQGAMSGVAIGVSGLITVFLTLFL